MPPSTLRTWLWDIRDDFTSAERTLVVFPHAGASAQSYIEWADVFPRTVRIAVTQYPARGSRFLEPPVQSIAELARPLAQVISTLPVPVHIFGHSLGAIVAFEVAWQLQCDSRPVGHLFASAASAPTLIRPPARPTCLMSDSEVTEQLRKRGGLPDEVLNNSDLLEMVLSIVRDDFRLMEEYDFGSDHRKLTSPVTVLGGRGDLSVPISALERWQDVAQNGVELATFDGGHFYLNDDLRGVATFICSRLQNDS